MIWIGWFELVHLMDFFSTLTWVMKFYPYLCLECTLSNPHAVVLMRVSQLRLCVILIDFFVSTMLDKSIVVPYKQYIHDQSNNFPKFFYCQHKWHFHFKFYHIIVF